MLKMRWLGAAAGLAVLIGGTVWAVRRFLGSDDSAYSFPDTGADGASLEPRNADFSSREGLDPTLLEILACPDCKQPVIYQREGDAERLTCTNCGKRYPVRDGIPVMLIDEAEAGPVPTEAEVAAAKALAPQGKPALVGAAPGSAPNPASSVDPPATGPSGTTTARAPTPDGG